MIFLKRVTHAARHRRSAAARATSARSTGRTLSGFAPSRSYQQPRRQAIANRVQPGRPHKDPRGRKPLSMIWSGFVRRTTLACSDENTFFRRPRKEFTHFGQMFVKPFDEQGIVALRIVNGQMNVARHCECNRTSTRWTCAASASLCERAVETSILCSPRKEFQ